MESSRRAVEAYRRTRLIDGVTSDDDKVAPVYKLDEISVVLQSAPLAVVHEMVEYIFKRLDNKSPIVKQKTLRLIKFVVGKSGSEFKREVQRQSAAIRQLFHYKGKPDPLKGDNLNKAVRETAHEAISAMFASEDKPPVVDETRMRIEGFGSTNYDSRMSQEKKTLLDEVVDLGTASFKQGLRIISSHYGQSNNSSSGKSDSFKYSGNGNYEAPKFRASSFSDRDSYRDAASRESLDIRDNYNSRNNRGSYLSPTYEVSKNVEQEQENLGSDADERKENGSDITSEENLLNRMTPSGGVRLQPSREKVQDFLVEASKLKPDRLYSAFEQRLQAQSWQVRLKTLCFLEAILRQRDVKTFGELSTLFEENCACILECENSPQTSLRDRAKKVLQILSGVESQNGTKTTFQAPKATPVELPDLLDTTADISDTSNNGLDLLAELAGSTEQDPENAATSEEQDPFAGMAIHATQAQTTSHDFLLDMEAPSEKSSTNDSGLFEGLSVSEETAAPKLFEGLSISEETSTAPKLDALADLLSGLTMDNQGSQGMGSTLKQPGSSSSSFGQSWPTAQPSVTQPTGTGFSLGQFGNPQVFHPGYASFPQQGFPVGLNIGMQATGGPGQASFGGLDGFDFTTNPYASTAGVTVRKEDTKAFDFISDHVSAARKK